LLLGLILVVKDDIGEPAIAFHAAYDLDLLEVEVKVGIELGVVEHEGAVLRLLVHDLLHRRIHVVLGERLGHLGRAAGRSSGGRSGGVVLGKILGEEELLRLLDVLIRVLLGMRNWFSSARVDKEAQANDARRF